jgi:hypothetical protein
MLFLKDRALGKADSLQNSALYCFQKAIKHLITQKAKVCGCLLSWLWVKRIFGKGIICIANRGRNSFFKPKSSQKCEVPVPSYKSMKFSAHLCTLYNFAISFYRKFLPQSLQVWEKNYSNQCQTKPTFLKANSMGVLNANLEYIQNQCELGNFL